MSRENLQAPLQDPRNGPLESRENIFLDYVIRAVRHPHAVADPEISTLRQPGWTEQDIFDAVAHGALHTAVDILFEIFRITPLVAVKTVVTHRPRTDPYVRN